MNRSAAISLFLVIVLLATGTVVTRPAQARPSNAHVNVLENGDGLRGPPASGRLTFGKHEAQPLASLPAAVYDEQLFSSFALGAGGLFYTARNLSYYVVAVAQGGQYGYGPTYFLNGRTDSGGWYQLGLAYNWTYASGGYNPGFYGLYEVWNSSGYTVDPNYCGFCSQFMPFNAPVQPGDKILLNLDFTGANITMTATDENTTGTASTSYSAQGATEFVGNPSYPFDNFGFFTGPMTEQYFVSPYYGTEQPVTYTNAGSPTLTSEWLWLDEYDPYTGITQYSCRSTNNCLPNPYTLTGTLQSKTYDGGVIVANSTTIITGNAPLTILGPTPAVSSLQGGQSVTINSTSAINTTPPTIYQWLEKTPTSSTYSVATDCSNGNPASSTPISCRFATTNQTTRGTYGFAVRVADTANTTQEAGIKISQPATVRLDARTTNTLIAPSPATIKIGGTITLAATVSDTDMGTSSTPSGNITWSDNGSGGKFNNASSCLLSSGSCTVNYTPSSAGPETITADYSGDSYHASSSATTSLQVVIGFQLSTTFGGTNSTMSGNFTVNTITKLLTVSTSLTVINATTGAPIYSKIVNFNETYNIFGNAYFIEDIPTNPTWISANCGVSILTSSVTCSVSRTPDITHSGVIGIVDVGIILGDYGFSTGNSNYNPAANLSASGTVNIIDVGIILLYYGTTVIQPL